MKLNEIAIYISLAGGLRSARAQLDHDINGRCSSVPHNLECAVEGASDDIARSHPHVNDGVIVGSDHTLGAGAFGRIAMEVAWVCFSVVCPPIFQLVYLYCTRLHHRQFT